MGAADEAGAPAASGDARDNDQRESAVGNGEYSARATASRSHLTGTDLRATIEAVQHDGRDRVIECQVHDDRHASLSVGRGDDGRVLLHCHAGCEPEAILQAEGLSWADVMAPRDGRGSSRSRIIETYDYTDEHRELLYQVCRMEPKSFRQRRPDGNGAWSWSVRGVRRVVYHLPDLQGREVVYVVEGERDVDALWAMEIPATCNAGGAGKWTDDYTAQLVDAGVQRVVVLPDNDDPGRQHAEQVARASHAAGLAVKVVELPDVPPKGDVSDYLNSGLTREDLVSAVKAATIYQPDEAPRSAMSAAETTPPGDAAADPAPDLSHDSLAYWLSREHFRGDARYVAAWGLWMLWDAVQWRADDRLRHLTLIRDYLRRTALTAPDPKTSRELRSDRVRSAVERTARSNPEIATSANVWDSDRWLLGTPGGTVDLRTGELRAPSREDFITRTTSVAPAEADPTRWRAFLERAFRSTPEIVPFLQRAAGYALTGETSEHKLLFAFGTGRNGKGVLMNTLTGLMGDYATVAPSATFLESGMDHHPTDLASLAGARLVTASELPPGKAWNEARIKSLTGGDPITARRMRQDFFTFDPQFTLMISGNHMPSFRGIDEAIRSRVLLIPFSEVIPPEERDPALQEKLRCEWPAVLQWAIEGALAWQEHGLAPPECVQAASDEYLESEDLLGEFVDERLVGAPDGFVRVRELYAAFREWCQERGTHPWVQHTLTKTLKERGYMVIRRNVGNGLVGYQLLTSDAPSYRDLTQGW